MLIPGPVAMAGVPPVRAPGMAESLLGRIGRRRPAPGLTVRRSFGPTTYDLSGLVDPAGGADALPPEHFLHYAQYESRRFVVCDGRDIVLARDSKAVMAPGLGLIDELNVGGGVAVPRHLLEGDFILTPRGWDVPDSAVKRLPGLSVPFCHYGQSAFGHLVLDGLLQIYLFRREIADGARLAHWLPPLPWIAPMLERAGVPPRQSRPLDAAVVLLERAALSSALAGQGVYFPDFWSRDFFAWLRATFMDGQPPAGTERVYLRRHSGYARRIENVDALEDLAHDHGFRIITPDELPFAEQVRVLAEAGTVLSPWGSTLTLAPLMGGARRVVELLPTSVTDAWFPRQAAVHRLSYLPVVHPSTADGDFEADLPRIDRVLSALPD